MTNRQNLQLVSVNQTPSNDRQLADEPSTRTPEEEVFKNAANIALAQTNEEQRALFDRLLVRKEPEDVVAEIIKPSLRKKKSEAKQGDTEKPPSGEMEYGTFAAMVNTDMDYRPHAITPMEMRASLETFSTQFVDKVLSSATFPKLMENMERFIEEELHTLFYRTNDYMSARVHQDYCVRFLDRLCLELGQRRQLDSSQIQQIEDLEAMYNLGLDAYKSTNTQVEFLTDNGSNCLLVEARDLKDKTEKEKPDAPKKSLEDYAYETMNSVLGMSYGIQSKHKVPPPFLVLLAEESTKLARMQASNNNPHVDLFDPHCEPELFENQYTEVLSSWAPRFTANPSMQNGYTLYTELQKKIRIADGLPEKFGDMLVDAAEAAEKKVNGMRAKIVNMERLMTQKPVKRMHKILNHFEDGKEAQDAKRAVDPLLLKQGIDMFTGKLESIGGCGSKEEVIAQLDGAVDHVYEHIITSNAVPATALAMKEFLQEFRKHLGSAMHAAGAHDERFLRHLKEVEDKADLVHETNRMVGNWVMDHTNEGHDSLFELGLHVTGASGPKARLTPPDVVRIMEYARETLRTLSMMHGVPESVASMPYVPLLFSRCLEIAHGEILDNEQMTGGMEFLPEHGTTAQNDRWRRKYERAHSHVEPEGGKTLSGAEKAQRMGKKVQKRGVAIFHQVLERMSSPPEILEEGGAETQTSTDATTQKKKAAPEQTSYSIDPTAHTLRLGMEFLDHIEHKRARTALH